MASRATNAVSTAAPPGSLFRGLKKAVVGSTGRCNTVGFGCCLDRGCTSGEAGSSWRVVCCGQEGVVGAVEGRGVHQRLARALHKPPGSIHGMLEATGGFSVPERRRRRCALTPAEREEISRGFATGESLRAIARGLGRSASGVCREVNRMAGATDTGPRGQTRRLGREPAVPRGACSR